MPKLQKISSILFVFLCLNLVHLTNSAQDLLQTITLAVPSGTESLFVNTILPRFYADNPNIYVALETISADTLDGLQDRVLVSSTNDYYERLGALMNRADVHWIYSGMLGVEASRAGYLLDLQAIVSTDTRVQPDDYYPAVWQAYQWDGGFWAFPALAAPIVLIYDPEAFDNAGIAYPSDSWTLEELANAARALSQPHQAGFFVGERDFIQLISILSEQRLVGLDGNPSFAKPEIAEVLQSWQTLLDDGAVTNVYSPDIPLQFAHIAVMNNEDQGTLLNGQAGLDVLAFAVSRGSQNPNLAYRLALYLSSVSELRSVYGSALPARRSLAEAYPENYQESLPESALRLRQDAVENAISPSSLLFGQYLSLALDGDEMLRALQDAQNQAELGLSRAEALAETVEVNVPLATAPAVAADDVVVDFALMGNQVGFANRSLWEDVISDFLMNNPDIDAINLNYIDPVMGYWDEIPKHECISNYPFTSFDSGEILALDPIIQADAGYNPDDLIGDVLQEVQIEGLTYAIPYAISPMMLSYNRSSFEAAGLPEPDGTWTVSQFVDSLRRLVAITDGPPLRPVFNDAAFWEMLMVSYGVVPIDYETEPPSLHLTDEAVLPVVQQVLDLGKNGLIDYQEMTTFFGYGTALEYQPALMANFLLLDGFNLEETGFVSFPQGEVISPVSFYSTSSFIFTNAEHPEACYRWLREITRHPELYRMMPAYHSLLDSPGTRALFGETGVASFLQFAEMLEAPNRVFVDPGSLGIGVEMFITRAYDRYVLEDADLARELENAVMLTGAYWHCMERSEDGDMFACLLEVDPSLHDYLEDVLPSE